MAKSATVQARINVELKNNVEYIFRQLEMTPSEAIGLFYKQVELNGGLPFNLQVPNYNLETLKAMMESEEIANNAKGAGYTSVDDMFEDILNG